MSTNNTKLTADEQKAMNHAIDMYAMAQMNKNGGLKAKPCILLPQFVDDGEGTYVPMENTGMRSTKKDGLSFLRFAMPYVAISDNGTPEVKVLKTNVFNDDNKLELLIAAHDMRIGDAMPDTVLVIEESLTAFSRSNPDQHLKVAGESNITCTFQGEYNGIVYETPCPIYRRVKLAPAGTKNTLIAHTNKDEISQWNAAARSKANSSTLLAAGNKAVTGGKKK